MQLGSRLKSRRKALLNRHLLTAPIFKMLENDQVKFCMFLKVFFKRSAYCAYVLNSRLCYFLLFVCFWSLYFWYNKLFILTLSDLFQAFPLRSTVTWTRVFLILESRFTFLVFTNKRNRKYIRMGYEAVIVEVRKHLSLFLYNVL